VSGFRPSFHALDNVAKYRSRSPSTLKRLHRAVLATFSKDLPKNPLTGYIVV
jgi:hypothetical protein